MEIIVNGLADIFGTMLLALIVGLFIGGFAKIFMTKTSFGDLLAVISYYVFQTFWVLKAISVFGQEINIILGFLIAILEYGISYFIFMILIGIVSDKVEYGKGVV